MNIGAALPVPIMLGNRICARAHEDRRAER